MLDAVLSMFFAQPAENYYFVWPMYPGWILTAMTPFCQDTLAIAAAATSTLRTHGSAKFLGSVVNYT